MNFLHVSLAIAIFFTHPYHSSNPGFTAGIFSEESTAQTENNDKTLDIEITVSKNLLLNKKDVDVYLDEQFLTAIKHGEKYADSIVLSQDLHHLSFTLSGNKKVFCEQDIRMNRDKTCAITIHTGKNKVEINKCDISYSSSSFTRDSFLGFYMFRKKGVDHYPDFITICPSAQIYVKYTYYVGSSMQGGQTRFKSYDTFYLFSSSDEGVYYDPLNDDTIIVNYDENKEPVSVSLIENNESITYKKLATQDDSWNRFKRYISEGKIHLLPKTEY